MCVWTDEQTDKRKQIKLPEGVAIAASDDAATVTTVDAVPDVYEFILAPGLPEKIKSSNSPYELFRVSVRL